MATGSAGSYQSAVSGVSKEDDRRPTRLMTDDPSYRDSLGDKSWRRLAPEVRTRFSHKPRTGQTFLYRGVMRRVELSFYEVRLFGRNCRIPAWLTPGETTVRHEQLTGDRFRFSLSVDHPQLGRTIFQVGEFYSDVSDV